MDQNCLQKVVQKIPDKSKKKIKYFFKRRREEAREKALQYYENNDLEMSRKKFE